MNGPEALILDLVEWVSRRPRTYGETMDVWRTSCPRLPVWEDAIDRGLVRCDRSTGVTMVLVTDAGHALMSQRGRVVA